MCYVSGGGGGGGGGGGSQTKPVADTSLIPAILTTKLIVESYCSTTVHQAHIAALFSDNTTGG